MIRMIYRCMYRSLSAAVAKCQCDTVSLPGPASITEDRDLGYIPDLLAPYSFEGDKVSVGSVSRIRGSCWDASICCSA